MGLLDLIFGGSSRYPHIKVYGEIIERIPAFRFSRDLIVTLNGEKQTISGQKTKDMLKRFVQGGKSLNLLDEKLKSIGLSGDKLEKRKWLMGIIEAEVIPEQKENDKNKK